MPVRVWRRRVRGWRKPPGSLMVTRPHRWSNPFKPGGKAMVWREAASYSPPGGWRAAPYDGPLEPGRYEEYELPRVCEVFEIRAIPDAAAAVALFRVYAEDIERRDPGVVARELGGRDLGCFCAPPAPCHVDVLLDLANPGE